jgi:hypothetical protein
MNTPLFTAEASLYRTSFHYNTTSTYFFADRGNVMPQQMGLRLCPEDCIPQPCECFVAEGCPCCPPGCRPSRGMGSLI